MAQPNGPGKAMSSRLLTMKFMQRSGAESPSSSPSTPTSERGSKRQRLSNGSHYSTPSSTPHSDAKRVQEAQATDERIRTDAVEREGIRRGETKWYLSFKEPPAPSLAESPLRIVSAGYSILDGAGKELLSEDNSEDEIARPQIQGRRSFGKFNRKLEQQQNPDASSSASSGESASDDEEDEDESDDPTGQKAMITQARKEAGDKARAERKAKRKADEADLREMAEERRRKHVKLNKLTSISGGGGSGGAFKSPGRGKEEVKCFNCGKEGHMSKECPKRQGHKKKT